MIKHKIESMIFIAVLKDVISSVELSDRLGHYSLTNFGKKLGVPTQAHPLCTALVPILQSDVMTLS